MNVNYYAGAEIELPFGGFGRSGHGLERASRLSMRFQQSRLPLLTTDETACV
jgi:hypothetical protein